MTQHIPQPDQQSLKYIYLDQNKWIDLANAVHNTRPGKSRSELVTLYEKAHTAVRQGSVVFPMGIVHLYETLKCPDPAQRQRLARVMVDLSRNMTIAPQERIVEDLLQARLLELLQPGANAATQSVFGRGIRFATDYQSDLTRDQGLSKRVTYLVAERQNSPTGTLWFLTNPNEKLRQTSNQSVGGQAVELASRVEAFRDSAQARPKSYRRNEYIRQTTEFYQPLIESILAEMGCTLDQLANKLGGDWAGFFDSIPVINVLTELSTERDDQMNRAVDPNDYADVVALGTAIPYCDVVVTERFWTELAKRKRLDEEYGCTVMSDLLSLEPYL